MNFDRIYPWSGIRTIQLQSNSSSPIEYYVKIPKFYVKVKNNDLIGKKCWYISGIPRSGYHIHPAFMKNYKEIDCFYIGAYEASQYGTDYISSPNKFPAVNINWNQSKLACENKMGGGNFT